MRVSQVLGFAIFAAGIVLLGFGYHSSRAPVERLSNTFLGHFTGQTTWYFVLGVIAVIIGGAFALFGRNRN